MSRGFRRHVAVAVACVLALAIAGCMSVPTSGPVTRVSSQPGRVGSGVVIAPAPPAADASPIEVVEGFLHAMAAWQPNYRVAREYLTVDADAAWDPEAGVWVYAEGNPVVATDTSARLRAPLVGSLGAGGAYHPASGQVDHDFGLVHGDDGQWRIGNPPQGLLISQYLFSGAFVRTPVYYFAAGADWLVPDPRFFPRGQQAFERACRAVTEGPTDWLAPAVDSDTAGVVCEGIAVDDAGVARILLKRGPEEPSVAQRQALVTQYAWTLRSFATVTAVQLAWSGEEPWVVAPFGQTVPVTAYDDAAPQWRQASRQPYGVVDGHLVRVPDAASDGSALVVAPGVRDAVLAAVRPDALQAAAVLGGRDRLVLAPLVEGEPELVRTSPGMRKPRYSRQGELWISDDRGQISFRLPDGHWVDLTIGGVPNAQVEAFRLAPDGVRIALVLRRPDGGTDLGLARVVRAGGRVSVDEFRAVLPPGDGRVVDVAWRTPDLLVVLMRAGETESVWTVAEDGSSTDALGPDLGVDLIELAASPDAPPLVRTTDGVVQRWSADLSWSVIAEGIDSVFYPG